MPSVLRGVVTLGENGSAIATLDAIVDDALAVTIGAPTASTIDELEVIRRLEAALSELVTRATEMSPGLVGVLDTLTAKLVERLKGMPKDVEHAAFRHRAATLKWRPDPPTMPRAITAFMVLESLRVARATCIYETAKARYQALRTPGDRCDCAARIGAHFLYGRPEAPLELVDSSGVAYAAMEYLWRCQACGVNWHEDESHDDFGSHSAWTPAPREALTL
jgi:hypothetical protein